MSEEPKTEPKVEDVAKEVSVQAPRESSLLQPDCVVVAESASAEPIELPLSAEDGTLGLATLSHAFPGAHGLKFKNPATGATRALL